jgi:hypothetical protein
MNGFKKLSNLFLLSVIFAYVFTSCKKDAHISPNISFKAGGVYTSADETVETGVGITVGITADKVEDDMRTYNVSYSYDNATTTTTVQNFSLTGSEQQHYDKDVIFTTRDQAGTEKYFFTITDKDGNIAQKELTLTVQ